MTGRNTAVYRIPKAAYALLETTGIDLDPIEGESLAWEAGTKKDSDHRLKTTT